jgi:PKD repeat protein
VVSNERNPVAGIVGPPTGTNAGCVPIRMRFINNSSLSSPSTTFTWDFGNGETIVRGFNAHKDTLFYTYKRFLCNGIVKLTQTNNCGSSFATWNPIMASSKDTAIIAPTNPTNCNLAVPFTFNNTSQNRFCSTPNNKKYLWVWGDGTNSGWSTSSASQSKTYSKRGVYQVLLIDSNGCGKDTARYTLRIVGCRMLAFGGKLQRQQHKCNF